MVVLEGTTMLTVGNNQYLQPDYMSPVPSMLDSKKSPLALLAQTCSQIGADTGSMKPLALDKSKKSTSDTLRSPSSSSNPHNNNNNSSSTNLNKSEQKSPEIKLAFKPYEANVLSRKTDDRPASKSSASDEKSRKVPSRSSDSSPPSTQTASAKSAEENGKSTPSADRKTTSPNEGEKGASPIIRSGLEVLQGSPKESMYKSGAFGINPLTGVPYSYTPGMEHAANPAFRSPYFSPHHAAMLAAAAGYSGQGAPSTPFLSYARVKTPQGGEALVPVCKDPYCTGCQFSAHNQQMLMGTPCPAGCTQCEQQKYGLAMAMSQLPAGHPYSQLAAGRGYVCSWIVGGTYCGKRYETSDELFQHLRSHTPNLNDPTAAAAALAAQQSQLLNPLSSLFAQSALHRAYQNPPLSPLSAARYHPYAKPGAMPPSLAGSPYGAFNPAALGPYYSPYAAAMFSQRMGAAHP